MKFGWHVFKEWSLSLVLTNLPGLFWLIAIYFGWVPFTIGLVSFATTFAYFLFLTQCNNWLISSRYVTLGHARNRLIPPYSAIMFLVVPLIIWLAFWIMSLRTLESISIESVYYWLAIVFVLVLAIPILRLNYRFSEYSYAGVTEATQHNEDEQMIN